MRMTIFLPVPGSRSMRPVRSQRGSAFEARSRFQPHIRPNAAIDAASITPAWRKALSASCSVRA